MESLHHLHLTNFWPIIVSALILWMLGAVWYSPALFVKPWMAALGISPTAPKKGLAFGMVASLIGDLILAFFFWHVIAWSHASTWGEGALVATIVWLGFFAAPNFPQGIYERRPPKLFLINNGYWLVGLLITGVLLAVWK